MLYHLFYPLSDKISAFNIFRYLSFRAMVAFLLAAVISIIWGKMFIRFMKNKQFGQMVRDDGPEAHLKKQGTPTMGGVFILGSILFAMVFAGNFESIALIVTLLLTFAFFLLGFRDDYLKIKKKNTDGVSGKSKLFWQFLTALIGTWALVHYNVVDTKLYAPFIKGPLFDMGLFYIPFAAFVIVGSSNAVNLTDGLDGLAIGPIMTSSFSLGVLAYIAGHKVLSEYLFVPYIEGVGELSILACAMIGAGVGFLWYNTYPAQIFMGDVGSLSLGGALGTMAVVSKNELLFVLIGGIFVSEALSVILQVGSYKIRKKRIFKMAPIHHHFELKGWAEPKVIVRFWIISLFLAIVSIATLKMR